MATIHAEDGFKDDAYLKDVARLLREYCVKYQIENNATIPDYEMSLPYIKQTYPECTIAEFERAKHNHCPDFVNIELTKNSVYTKIKHAYLAFPKNVGRLAETAGVTEDLASLYIRHWGSNNNTLSSEAVVKFNKYYESYLEGEIFISEFAKNVIDSVKGSQFMLLYMKENFLISKYHYQSFKEKHAIRGLDFTITGDYINKIYKAQNGKCVVTGQDVCSFYNNRNAGSPSVYSIDRIDNNKGYIPGNIRLTTKIANMSRGSLTTAEYNNLLGQAGMHRLRKNPKLNHVLDEIEKTFNEYDDDTLNQVIAIKNEPVNDDLDDLLTVTQKQSQEQTLETFYLE